MGLLTRYKKAGGVEQLIELLETSNEKKRENLLGLIRDEDAVFAKEVESKLLFFDDIFTFNDLIIAEIIAHVPIKYLSYSIYDLDEDRKNRFLNNAQPMTMNQIKEEMEVISINFDKNLILPSRNQVVKKVRELMKSGSLKIEIQKEIEIQPSKKEEDNNEGGGPEGTNTADSIKESQEERTKREKMTLLSNLLADPTKGIEKDEIKRLFDEWEKVLTSPD